MKLFRKRVDQDEKLLKNIERYEKEGVSEWFNYKGYTYIFDKMAKS